jgi:hypothetical protein
MSKLDPVKLNPAFSHHASHGLGDHVEGHAVKGNIARDGAPKRVHDIKVHGGMVKHTADGSFRAFAGDDASYLDSISGASVPAARNTSTPGYGNAGVQSGHPFAKPPGGKNLKPVPPSFGMRSRSAAPNTDMHALGAAILDAAFSVGSPDDKAAHGRKPDGSK